jgi:hypothetical protein
MNDQHKPIYEFLALPGVRDVFHISYLVGMVLVSLAKTNALRLPK